MIPSSRGLNRFSSQQSGQSKINSVGERFPINRTLMEVIKGLEGASSSMLTGFSVITLLMVGLLGYLIISGKKKSSSNSEHDEYF